MSQREYFGFGSIQKLRKILRDNKAKKIFLVTGRNSYHKSGASSAISYLLKDYNVLHFQVLSPIPSLESLDQGIRIFKEENCDLVIAAGGGSVIDTAKLTNILTMQHRHPLDYIKRARKIDSPGKPLVAIPTTAGSGSEATHFAVVYVNKEKFSVASKYLLPTHSIIDPDFTTNLPPKITASSGMDALSQAIESFWSKSSTTVSRKYSKKSIKLVLANLEDAVKDPTRKSRLAMSKASNLAGKAINITKTTGPHAMSYPITSYFGIAHGHAVGLTLAEFLSYNSELDSVSDANARKYTRTHMLELFDSLGVPDATSAKNKISKLMLSIGLETRLSQLNITDDDIEIILKNVNPERLANNPRIVTRKALTRILTNIK